MDKEYKSHTGPLLAKHNLITRSDEKSHTSPPKIRRSPVGVAAKAAAAKGGSGRSRRSKSTSDVGIIAAAAQQDRSTSTSGATPAAHRMSPDTNLRKSPDAALRRSTKRASPDLGSSPHTTRRSPFPVGTDRPRGYLSSTHGGARPKPAAMGPSMIGRAKTIKPSMGGVGSKIRKPLMDSGIADDEDMPAESMDAYFRSHGSSSPSPTHEPQVMDVPSSAPASTGRIYIAQVIARQIQEQERERALSQRSATAQELHVAGLADEGTTVMFSPGGAFRMPPAMGRSATFPHGSPRPSPRGTYTVISPSPAPAHSHRTRAAVHVTASGVGVVTDFGTPDGLPETYEELEALKHAIEEKQRVMGDAPLIEDKIPQQPQSVHQPQHISSPPHQRLTIDTSHDHLTDTVELELLHSRQEQIMRSIQNLSRDMQMMQDRVRAPAPDPYRMRHSQQIVSPDQIPTHPEEDEAHNEHNVSPIRNGTRVFVDDRSAHGTPTTPVCAQPPEGIKAVNSPFVGTYVTNIHSPRGSAFSTLSTRSSGSGRCDSPAPGV